MPSSLPPGPRPSDRGFGGARGGGGGYDGGGGNGDADALAAKVRAKLDFVATKANFESAEEEAERVKASLDRLAFASNVSNVQSAFGAMGKDLSEEADALASKATETVALFQAAQYAAKWMPIEGMRSMKPT